MDIIGLLYFTLFIFFFRFAIYFFKVEDFVRHSSVEDFMVDTSSELQLLLKILGFSFSLLSITLLLVGLFYFYITFKRELLLKKEEIRIFRLNGVSPLSAVGDIFLANFINTPIIVIISFLLSQKLFERMIKLLRWLLPIEEVLPLHLASIRYSSILIVLLGFFGVSLIYMVIFAKQEKKNLYDR